MDFSGMLTNLTATAGMVATHAGTAALQKKGLLPPTALRGYPASAPGQVRLMRSKPNYAMYGVGAIAILGIGYMLMGKKKGR